MMEFKEKEEWVTPELEELDVWGTKGGSEFSEFEALLGTFITSS